MKILVIGDGHSEIHEVAVVGAFKELGHEVRCFYWNTYFKSLNQIIQLIKRIQHKFIFGPTIVRLNRDIVNEAINFKPDLIFIYRGTHITPKTINKIKKIHNKCKIFGYNNDDPFAPGHPPWLWRHFVRSIPVYDLVFAYRHRNLDSFFQLGANDAKLLRSYFIPKFHYPITLSDEDNKKYKCDIVFIGHYENDGRLECLEEIVKSGYHLRLFGPPYEWNKLLLKSETLKHLSPVHLVWNADYTKAICGGKIGLCFFSKLNRDTYTRRCFEIPATGTMLLSEYSDDLASIYQAGKEADFFKCKKEMINKINFYMKDDPLRRQVAKRGHQRVINEGHDVVSRMAKVLDYVK